jgi:hypothetical protein
MTDTWMDRQGEFGIGNLEQRWTASRGASCHEGLAAHMDLMCMTICQHRLAWHCTYARAPSPACSESKACCEPCMSHQPACQSRNATMRRISSHSSCTSSSQQWARARALHNSMRSAIKWPGQQEAPVVRAYLQSCSPSSLLLKPEVFQIHDILGYPTVWPPLCLSGMASLCLLSGLKLLSKSSVLPSLTARFTSASLAVEYLSDKVSMWCSALLMIPFAWVFARCPQIKVSLYL